MNQRTPSPSLPPVDPEVDLRFRLALASRNLGGDDQFIADYVDWEWRHARHVFEELPRSVAGLRVLEFGCHLGATAVVLALLGADVVATDVDAELIALARLNAERYGVSDRIRFVTHARGAPLPFEDGAFDLVSCNSVLEYVRKEHLPGTQRELARVLRPGGLVVVIGTSNGLWPREAHSQQWLTNYLPRFVDRLVPKRLRRGVSPFALRNGFPGCRDLLADDTAALARTKARMGAPTWKVRVLEVAAPWLRLFRLSPAVLMPTLTMWMSKPA
jgi:2-polyprenyl-3-methyl-5-hydroxy-6-metoxy-1,4-benzoquinol methylase